MNPSETKERVVDPEWANVFHDEVSHVESLEEALGHIKIFSLLTDRELQKLARIVHIRRYSKGEIVVQRGVEQSGFYLVLSGSVDIVREKLDKTKVVVGNLGTYELLGEFALLDSTPRNSSIVAAEPCELVGFFKPDLMRILATNPVLGCKIVLRLAEEMSRSLARDYGKLQDAGYPFPETVPESTTQQDPTIS